MGLGRQPCDNGAILLGETSRSRKAERIGAAHGPEQEKSQEGKPKHELTPLASRQRNARLRPRPSDLVCCSGQREENVADANHFTVTVKRVAESTDIDPHFTIPAHSLTLSPDG